VACALLFSNLILGSFFTDCVVLCSLSFQYCNLRKWRLKVFATPPCKGLGIYFVISFVTVYHVRCNNYTGYQWDSQWNLSLLSWLYKALNKLAPPYLSAALPPPGAVSFDHQTVSDALLLALVHVLEMEHSSLPDLTFGIPHVCRLGLSLDTFFSETENVFNCLKHQQRLVTVAFRRWV